MAMLKNYVVQKSDHGVYIKSGFCQFVAGEDYDPAFFEVIREPLLPKDAFFQDLEKIERVKPKVSRRKKHD